MLTRLRNHRDFTLRAVIVAVCMIGLVVVYFFQHFDYSRLLFGTLQNPNMVFIINKSTRLIINDSLCLGLIYGLYYDPQYVKLGSIVQLCEMFVLLPLYFYFKLTLEGTSEISSPLLSQIHRLIVNPTLMILLIVGFYYQLQKSKE